VSSWLARQNNLKPNSYNELSRQIKNIFDLALNDRVISRSPYAGATNKRKRVAREPDAIPSAEQFERIVEAIRDQRVADHAQDSADSASPRRLAREIIPASIRRCRSIREVGRALLSMRRRICASILSSTVKRWARSRVGFETGGFVLHS
jgi:hypothetical protein